MIILLLSSLLYATGIHSEELQCPIGEDITKIFLLISSNEFGGYDSDGATYSSGTQYREYAISTCYQNLYSAYGRDMKKEWSSEDEKQILEIIEKQKSLMKDPNNPEVWERYELATEIYRWQGKSHQFLSSVYLEAAWTVRDEAVGIHQSLTGPMTADEVLYMGGKELSKELTSSQRKMVIFNLARVAHRNGRNKVRDEYLSRYEDLPDLTAEEKKLAQDFKILTTEIEPKYIKLAIDELEKHIETKSQDGQNLYLLGDLYRRIGNMEQSQKYFNRALVSSNLHEEQRAIIQYFFP
jgi:tetratricopeptide (TPR) repeat protein